jgi:YD repeat-containing protein
VISATNQNARTVGFGYDSAGRLSTVTDPLGHVTTITYLPPPDATTGAALAVGASTATITGSVTPKTAPGTSYHFDFGTSLRYGRITPPGSLPGGSAAVAVTSRLSGLRPNTTYHYRVAASNRNGGALGLDRTFRTAPVCTVPQLIGRSLSQARRALVANHCRLGTVHRPRHVSRRTHLRITAQRPGAKAVLPAGGKVNVKLGKT